MKKLRTFLANEDGAVTVDWIVLTAATVGFVILIATSMQDGAVGLADALSLYMTNWSFG